MSGGRSVLIGYVVGQFLLCVIEEFLVEDVIDGVLV